MIHEEAMKKSMLSNYVSPFLKYLRGEMSLVECTRIQESIKNAEEECKRITFRGVKLPSVREVVGNRPFKELRPEPIALMVKENFDKQKEIYRSVFNEFGLPKQYLKESEKTMINERVSFEGVIGRNDSSKVWSMYGVIVVDKDSLEIVKNERVVAKNFEHAKGLAGYNKVLEDKHYDNTKLVVKVAHITDVRPVEEDE